MPSGPFRPILAACAALSLMGAAQAADQPVTGYLDPSRIPDTARILPPPPARESGREADDRAAFTATRGLAGQPRWRLATADVVYQPAQGLADFACAAGVRLDAETAPTVLRIFRRVTAGDVALAVNPPKDLYQRPRPYRVVDPGATVCTGGLEALAKNGAYPSGHAALGWTWGLVLAELAPDRATQILMRARAFGESRVVCGVHYPSDIEAGRMAGSILVAALHADPVFRADMDRARGEVAAARAAGPAVSGEACAVEAAAGEHPPY